MGCSFSITVVAEDSIEGYKYIDMAINEIVRIEKKISSWDKNSMTSKINRFAGISPVKIDKELFGLIERSLYISKVTDGAFDISYASMDKVWQFDGSMKNMPLAEDIKKSVEKVGFENILLNKAEQSIFLKKRGMKIGFGAIGKGYAADKAKELLIQKGVVAGVINASGDIMSWGKQANGKKWNVVIINPFNKKRVFASSPLISGAVVTSGNYEKFAILNGERYAHIINPKTGYPSKGIMSATVYASKAELADALATSIFVMGIDVGIDRINQIPNTECIVIDDKGITHHSTGIKIMP